MDVKNENSETIESTSNFSKKEKKKSPWKYIINIVIVLIVTIGAVAISLAADFKNIVESFKTVNWFWIGMCFLMVILAAGLRSLILFAFARLYTRNYHYHQALACDSIGTFYNSVTPGASGGQVIQAYTYKKQGVPISAAASILVMYSIVYQIVLIVYGIVSFIVKYDTLMVIKAIDFTINNVPISIPILPLTIIGFALNLSVILIVLLMSYSRKFHNLVLGPIISFLAKIKIVKNPNKLRENLRVQVENFKIELRRLLSNIPFTILVTILFFLVVTLTYSIPFFAGKALGAEYSSEWISFWDSIYYGNYHQMITGLIPIPGSAGASEYFFNQLFYTYYNSSGDIEISTLAAQLIWRTITFTIPLIIGGFVAAFYRSSPKENIPQEHSFRDTFVSLQKSTYVERKQSADAEFDTMRLNRELIRESLKRKKEKDNLDKEQPSRRFDQTDWSEIEVDDTYLLEEESTEQLSDGISDTKKEKEEGTEK
ncbi:MAG: lysylphosphatidylglycerol synthase transmembrane domain-containing protein [Bacilli bacterium]|jgi:uncharacterized protein (TIRG00374 family)|nr:lysylphosphatidylglycerol synthase transmembrane domain-containing protein [Bacilli bacterium]